MSIASRITSMENNIRNAYHGLDSIGIDTTNTNKNIENISALLEDFYDTLPKVSGTGTNISLSPTRKGRITSQINGDTFQQTYTGKNLLPYENTTTTARGVTITHNTDGSITLNGTSTSAGAYDLFSGRKQLIDTSKTYVFSSGVTMPDKTFLRLTDSSSSSVFINIASAEGSANDKIFKKFNGSALPSGSVSCLIYIYSGYTFNNYTIYPMLEEGTSMTEFEPYVGGTASPNPDYPQEIQSVTGLQKISNAGKNLLNCVSNSVSNKGIELKIENSNYLTIKGTATQNYPIPRNTLNLVLNTPIPAGTYTFSVSGTYNGTANKSVNWEFYDENDNMIPTTANIGPDGTENYKTIISTVPIKTIKFFRNMSANQTIDFDLYLQFEKGTTATTYEAYSGETYDINLGKNLFDGIIELGGLDDSTGLPYANNNALRSKNYIPVNSSKQYTLSNNKNYHMRIYEYDENYQFIQMLSTLFQGSGTFTTSATTKYIKFRTISSSVENDLTSLWQLEQGTEATSYSEYFTPIHLYENDQIIGTPDNWSIKHTKKEVIFDGNENWNITQNNSVLYVTNIEDYAVSNNIPYSNYFQGIVNVGGAGVMSSKNENTMAFINNHTNYRLYIKKTTFASVSEFKTWLSTHNTKVVYELETPTTEPITNTELISQLNAFYYAMSKQGQTNISVEGNLPMILDVSALKGDE